MPLLTQDTVLYDGTVYTRTADGKFFYSPEDDGCIIDENGNYFDNQTGEFIVNVVTGSDTEYTEDSSGGGFFGELWSQIKKQFTDPDNIKAIFKKYVANGDIVRPTNPNPPKASQNLPAKSNTMLYVVIGVAVLAIGVGIYMATKNK